MPFTSAVFDHRLSFKSWCEGFTPVSTMATIILDLPVVISQANVASVSAPAVIEFPERAVFVPSLYSPHDSFVPTLSSIYLSVGMVCQY
jgi:hypothetical protein